MTATAQDEEARTARADWEQRIYRRLTDTTDADPSLALPAPSGLTATAGTRTRAPGLGRRRPAPPAT